MAFVKGKGGVFYCILKLMDIGHEPMGRLEYGYASDYIVNQAVS